MGDVAQAEIVAHEEPPSLVKSFIDISSSAFLDVRGKKTFTLPDNQQGCSREHLVDLKEDRVFVPSFPISVSTSMSHSHLLIRRFVPSSLSRGGKSVRFCSY